MPVTRYRSVEDMPPPEPRPPLHPDNLRIAFEWSVAMLRLRRERAKPGVTRRDLRDPTTELAVNPRASR